MIRRISSMVLCLLLVVTILATVPSSADGPVNNPPVANAGGPYTGDEGSPITFDASDSSDPDGDPLQYRWDFDNNGVWDTAYSTDPTATHTWYDDHSGTAKVEVYDGELTDTATATVNVYNVAPTASIDAVIQQVALFKLPGQVLEFHGSFTDPGTDDTHAYVWQLEEGVHIYNELVVTHAYDEPGTYTVFFFVVDDDLGYGLDSVEVVISSVDEAAGEIIDAIEDMDLHRGTEKSLISKLKNVIKSIDKDNIGAAVNQLEAFINEVEALRGDKLTDEQADELISAAQAIIDYLNGL